MGSFGFLLSFDRDLREPLMLPQWSQASSRVEAGNSVFLSSCDRHLRLLLELQ